MLSDRERVYADAVLSGVDPRKARIGCGIPARYPAETYNPAIRDYMDSARGRLIEEAHVSRTDVLNGFKRAIDDAIFAGDPGNQIAGWREIAKILGYYEPSRIQIELSPSQANVISRIQALSDSELIQLATTEWAIIDTEMPSDDH